MEVQSEAMQSFKELFSFITFKYNSSFYPTVTPRAAFHNFLIDSLMSKMSENIEECPSQVDIFKFFVLFQPAVQNKRFKIF